MVVEGTRRADGHVRQLNISHLWRMMILMLFMLLSIMVKRVMMMDVDDDEMRVIC